MCRRAHIPLYQKVIKYLMPCLIVLTLAGILFADTYIYIADANANTAQTLLAMTQGKDVEKSPQPFYLTYVLTPTNTNYLILKMTSKNGQNPRLESPPGIDLYQVQKLTENGIETVIDNSALYATSFNWSLNISSGGN